MITKINGKIWRDLDGDGKFQKKEPLLEGVVFWDKDQNGEHNKSNEPAVRTDKKGNFAFEWISDQYPTSIRLGSKIEDYKVLYGKTRTEMEKEILKKRVTMVASFSWIKMAISFAMKMKHLSNHLPMEVSIIP